MKLKDFSFRLPADRIARFPLFRRDQSRLMIVERKTGNIFHYRFKDIIRLIDKDDFMVINTSRVIPVKLFGRIGNSEIEILIVKNLSANQVEALTLPAKKFKRKTSICFGSDLSAKVLGVGTQGKRILEFNKDFNELLKHGYAPLPPYLKRKSIEAMKYKKFDLTRYQTVYSHKPGSIAAPTAGLHFTPSLLNKIKQDVEVLEINLEVAEATFQTIRVENIEDHKMGKEIISIKPEAKEKIEHSKKKKHLVAVGTTTVRALESYALEKPENETFSSELFIYPGFNFQLVDKLITNFHLPESSLFILVSAFAGLDLMKKAYEIAVQKNYRFFSYGDAMFII